MRCETLGDCNLCWAFYAHPGVGDLDLFPESKGSLKKKKVDWAFWMQVDWRFAQLGLRYNFKVPRTNQPTQKRKCCNRTMQWKEKNVEETWPAQYDYLWLRKRFLLPHSTTRLGNEILQMTPVCVRAITCHICTLESLLVQVRDQWIGETLN